MPEQGKYGKELIHAKILSRFMADYLKNVKNEKRTDRFEYPH